jgi:carboxymethylenebutenolidase
MIGVRSGAIIASRRRIVLGQHFSLVASDSFKLGAYRAEPSGTAKGGIVVIQEIFGVNHHIRAVCDRLAGEGYAAVAPALFDRQHPNFECGYSPDEIANARKFVANPDWGAMMKDVQAAIDDAKKSGPTAIIGFCLGGSLAFLAAAKLNGLSAAIGYYGGQIVKNADEKPKVPTQLHFGEKDASIPMSDVEIIKQKRGGDCEIYVYAGAQHGFHCDERGSYDEASSKLAWQRSMAFLDKNLKK